MRRLTLGIGLLLACAGCPGPAQESPTPTPTPTPTPALTVTVIAGAPTPAMAAGRVAVTMMGTPSVLGGLHGGVAIGTDDRVVEATLPDGDLVEIPAVDDEGNDAHVGAVRQVARRSDGGVVVVADGGLFVDEEGLLLVSPLGKTIDSKAVLHLDALGSAETEELWLVTKNGVAHVAKGALETVSVPGSATIELAVGLAPSRALLVGGGEAWLVDTDKKTSDKLATGLGATHGADHGDDQTAFVATDGGLLALSPAGDATLRTFAPEGEKAVAVLGVSASFGSVLAVTGSSLIDVGAKGARVVGALNAPRAIATDADGDAWVLDAAGLGRWKTGAPVSFATDVVPFMKAHCVSCHENGTANAPKHHFTSYAVAKQYSPTIDKKLRAPAGMGVMPPADTEKLAPSDYAVVTRWVASGMLP